MPPFAPFCLLFTKFTSLYVLPILCPLHSMSSILCPLYSMSSPFYVLSILCPLYSMSSLFYVLSNPAS